MDRQGEIECYLFENLIDKEDFDSFTTPEKIEWCIRKDILFYGKQWTRDLSKFNCVDIDKIDFSIFKKLPFNLFEGYNLDGHSISTNPLFEEEVFGVFELQISISTHIEQGEIDFNMNLLDEKKEQLEFLRSKIKNNYPFGLENINVEHEFWSNELRTSVDSKYYFSEISFDYKLDWIYGALWAGSMFSWNYNEQLTGFASDYQKFSIASYCYGLLLDILHPPEEHDLNEGLDENSRRAKGFNCLAAVYFFDKLGIIGKMQKRGYPNSKIYSILGRLTSFHPKTIELKLKELLRPSKLNESRKKHLKEIDSIIEDLSDL